MNNAHYSISHCNSREQEALIKLKNAIVSLYKPLLVYCLGSSSFVHTSRNCFSRSRCSTGWLFSCDLLIVLPPGAQVSEATTRNMEQICEAYEDIRLLVHDWDFMVHQLQIHSLFFCWLPKPFCNMKRYALLAEQYYADNPEYERYTEPKLSPLPMRVISSTSLAEDATGT